MEEEYERERQILDEMYDFEEDFDQLEKKDGNYYIGTYICMKDVQMLNYGGFLVEDSNKLYLGISISAKLLFKYEYKYVQKYLCSAIRYCPHAKNYCLKTSILQLKITEDGLYLVIIKTYWLKIIQRHWKTIMKRRKEIIKRMTNYYYIRLRELGKHNKEVMDKLQGMLYIYSKKMD